MRGLLSKSWGWRPCLPNINSNYSRTSEEPVVIILSPGSQGFLEGLKAYRRDDGRVVLFRPEENAHRMKMGADGVCMPFPTVEQFVHAVKQTVLANKHWVISKYSRKKISFRICVRTGSSHNKKTQSLLVPWTILDVLSRKSSRISLQVPPPGKGSLYIRPLLMGTGAVLAMGPAPEFTFLVYAAPVGNFHKVNYIQSIPSFCSRERKSFARLFHWSPGKNIIELAYRRKVPQSYSWRDRMHQIHHQLLPGNISSSIFWHQLDWPNEKFTAMTHQGIRALDKWFHICSV